MKPVNSRDASTLTHSLLQRRMLVAFTLLMTYGAGFWLWLLHQVEGAIEPNEPPGVIHWLRDSSLSLPLVALGVFLGATLADRLLHRNAENASVLVIGAFAAVVLALYASVVLSVGNPLHGWLFEARVHGGGHDLPVAVHVVRDGLLALAANEVLALTFVAAVLSRRWMLAGRSLRTKPTAAVQPL